MGRVGRSSCHGYRRASSWSPASSWARDPDTSTKPTTAGARALRAAMSRSGGSGSVPRMLYVTIRNPVTGGGEAAGDGAAVAPGNTRRAPTMRAMDQAANRRARLAIAFHRRILRVSGLVPKDACEGAGAAARCVSRRSHPGGRHLRSRNEGPHRPHDRAEGPCRVLARNASIPPIELATIAPSEPSECDMGGHRITMKRRTLDLIFSTVGLVFAVVLLVLGLVAPEPGRLREGVRRGPARFAADLHARSGRTPRRAGRPLRRVPGRVRPG